MGTLRKRGNKFQMIVEVYRRRRRFFKAKSFDTEKEARDWERDLIYEIDRGLISRESLKRRTLADATNKYINTVLIHKKSRNSRNVVQHLAWWDQQIGGLELRDVTPAVLAECRDLLLTEVGPAGKVRKSNTVIRYIASISVVMETAVREWLWITQNPARAIKKPHVGVGKTRYFTHEEIQKIRKGCEESDSKFLLPIFITGLHTGMRLGEILSLKWADLSFEEREINLPTSKNGEPRDVPMTGEVYQILRSLYKSLESPSDSGLVFPSPHDPTQPIDIRPTWTRVLKREGIQGATFHTLRHTACSYLAQLGLPSVLIARIAGHKDSRTTDRYTHAVKEHTRKAIEEYEKLLRAGSHA